MRIILIISLFFCFQSVFLFAQENRLKHVGVETGMTFMEGEMLQVDNIRAEISSYSSDYGTNNIANFSYKSFAGVKYEILSLNDRFGLLVGLRYSHIINTVSKEEHWNSNTNYFYWLHSQDGINTEYFRVKKINKASDYISVPVEVRYFPTKRPYFVRIYLKLGAEVSYLLQTKKDVDFYDNSMNSHESDLLSNFEDQASFNSSIYGGVGIRIGKETKPSLSIELCPLSLFLTTNSSKSVDTMFGGGFQINAQIPIKYKTK